MGVGGQNGLTSGIGASFAHVKTPVENNGPSTQKDKLQSQNQSPPGEAEIALVLDTFRGRDDFGNGECADCGALKPEWASMKEGTLVCLDCAGVHRCLSLPVQSMVRPE